MAECQSCQHSSDTCPECGGRLGYPPPPMPQQLPPCAKCIYRGPRPALEQMRVEVDSYLNCHPELVESLWEQYCGGSSA